jgi:anti-anti-sigma factor
LFDPFGPCPSLRVERARFPGGTVLIVVGEIDLATIGILEAELLETPRDGDVLIDLSDVSFIGAVGLRLLLRNVDASRARGHSFAVCALRPQHRRLLARLGILDQLATAEARRPFFEALPNAN